MKEENASSCDRSCLPPPWKCSRFKSPRETLLHTLPPAQSESSPPDCGHFCWKHWKSPACWCLSWEAGLPALPHASQTARPLAGGKRCWRRCFLPDLRKNKEMLSTNHRTIKYFWIKCVVWIMRLTRTRGSLGGEWLQTAERARSAHGLCGGTWGPETAASQSSGPEG